MALLTLRDAAAGLIVADLDTPAGGGDTMLAGIRAGGWSLPHIFVARNADATSTTVTINGVPYVVGATTGFLIAEVYSASYGTVHAITYSKVTSLKVGAFRLAAVP